VTRPPRRGPHRGPARALEARTAADAIRAALKFHGISDEVRAQRVLTEWFDLVGSKIASRTRPYGVTDRVLVIEVASSAWLHELNLLKNQILSGLLERLGEPKLFDELKFKLAGRSGARPTLIRPQPRAAAPPPRATAPATGVARENIVREVEQIDDEELRELIARVRIQNDR
jgi:predicted nucleic acid-binding Zn ribbon protein